MTEEELYNSAAQLEREAKWHGRIRAITVAACCLTATACLLADWSDRTDHHVFSGVRPAVKQLVARLYGREPQGGGKQE
jgi:hypothetical protein